jgi:hypothetical protein
MHLHVRVRSYVRMRVRAIVSVSIRVSMCKRTKTHVPTAIQVNGQTKNYSILASESACGKCRRACRDTYTHEPAPLVLPEAFGSFLAFDEY